MRFRRMSRSVARRRFASMNASGLFEPRLQHDDDRVLRARLLADLPIRGGGKEYEHDLAVGLGLYRHLGPELLGLRNAADDGVWRHLSLDVLPDVVARRAPAGSSRESWFWKSRWRLWFKRLWWYVHLTWQGSEETTRATVGRMTTDTIASMVERPGPAGFRVELWRTIASRFATRRPSEDELRRVMRLNTALLVTIEPDLSADGVEGYVDRLFASLDSPRTAGTRE